QNRNTVERLRTYGVQLEISAEKLAGQTDKLSGNTFVISGVFNKISRNELKKLIEDNGGKVSGSISSKTNYLVAGENMGPSKLAKAEKLGTNIISEDDFLNMLEN
ncbi:BRCT domain-containing protein, partial [Christiangramia aquimixticola]|uniref:BRCT domain-containing protein n=1 Tax=Christiangramia aquimixticola TaxID=1697558 RepID=UPI003AA8DFF6